MNDLLKKYHLEVNKGDTAEWKTQDSKENSILFYNLNDESEKSIGLFIERIKSVKFKYCIINTNKVKKKNLINIEKTDWLALQKDICDYLYPFNYSEKICIGITGTNGKTTTTDLLRQLLVKRNKNVLTIGTLGLYYNKTNCADFGLTSPSYIDFRKSIYKYKDTEFIICELSSHALEQNRLYDLKINEGIWTSFSQDHLDYHLTMEEYFRAKNKIYTVLKNSGSIYIDESDHEIIDKVDKAKTVIVTKKNRLKNQFFSVDYNQKNLALALCLLEKYQMTFNLEELETLTATPGRFELIENKTQLIVIDFAHTPDALENISKELRKTFPTKKLITVFGCGGNRDKSKRILMGKVAEKYSDFCYLTSDNPRFEDPMDIIEDIEEAFKSEKYKMIVDRSMAIKEALTENKNAVILVAGKGHENYIETEGIKTYFSDKEEVLKVIENDKNK